MGTGAVAVLFVVVWVSSGLLGAYWLARRGHRDPLWWLLGPLLGLLFLPIAAERAERSPRRLSRVEAARTGTGTLRVLVALDGSREAAQAFEDARRLLGPAVGTFVIAEVVDYDAGEPDRPETVTEAEDRLAAAVASVPGGLACSEVLAGPPLETLLKFAAEEGADAIVVGKRGRGMSVRLLGSVADGLVRRSPAPVLVGGRAPVP